MKYNHLMLKSYQPQYICHKMLISFSQHQGKNSMNQPSAKPPKDLRKKHRNRWFKVNHTWDKANSIGQIRRYLLWEWDSNLLGRIPTLYNLLQEIALNAENGWEITYVNEVGRKERQADYMRGSRALRNKTQFSEEEWNVVIGEWTKH